MLLFNIVYYVFFNYVYVFYCYVCSVLVIVFHCLVLCNVCVCSVLLPPGVNSIAVNEYIKSFN